MKKLIILFLLIISVVTFSQEVNIPTSTQLTISRAGNFNNSNELMNVCMIVSNSTQSKGTGFLIKTGHIITNHHVIKNSKLKDLILIFPDGKMYNPLEIKSDSIRDLAALKLSNSPNSSGFDLGLSSQLKLGTRLYSWGYPLGYNGPSPLLTVGYLAGYQTYKDTINNKQVDHLVINGAFNPGNSGGAIIQNGKVFGVVQSKHAPISNYLLSALNALEQNSSGVQYTWTDAKGNKKNLSEAQIVAQLLIYFREINQVMIGEAVTIQELRNFLKEMNILK